MNFTREKGFFSSVVSSYACQNMSSFFTPNVHFGSVTESLGHSCSCEGSPYLNFCNRSPAMEAE